MYTYADVKGEDVLFSFRDATWARTRTSGMYISGFDSYSAYRDFTIPSIECPRYIPSTVPVLSALLTRPKLLSAYTCSSLPCFLLLKRRSTLRLQLQGSSNSSPFVLQVELRVL